MIVVVNVHEYVAPNIVVRPLEVDVEPEHTVEMLKALIRLRDPSVPVHRAYLLYNGFLLEDERRCKDYNMLKRSHLHLIVRHSRGPLYAKQDKKKRTKAETREKKDGTGGVGSSKGKVARPRGRNAAALVAAADRLTLRQRVMRWLDNGGARRLLEALLDLD